MTRKQCCAYNSLKTGITSRVNTKKKVNTVIEFNQEAWLKPCFDMNTKLRTQAKKDFEKDYFKLMNNAVFGKTMEYVRKQEILN